MSEASGPGRGPQPGRVRFRVLGHLSAEIDGLMLPLGPHKQQLVLAMLLCHPNAPVSVDMLTEAVWDDDPPRTARKNLQMYISALRKLLAEAGEADRLVHHSGGYLLRLAETDLDSLRLRAMARAGREAAASGDLEAAVRLLRQARELWAGSPLPELRSSQPVQSEADRLISRYLAVCEDWAEAALGLGHAHEVVEAVGDLVEQHPMRERLRAAQMTALHRAGRRAEALGAFDGLRQHLSRELGLSPSPALEALYRSILAEGTTGAGVPFGTGPARRSETSQPGRSALLPPDTADFIGREDHVRELREALARGSAAVVAVGPAGAGKTALAIHVAHRLRDEFPGGQIFVRLREDSGKPRSLASLTAELWSSAGLTESRPGDPERAAALWRAWLVGRKVLLVLDDAPDETCVRLLLPGSGSSSAVVTARSQLAGLAPVLRVEVPPYSMAEALDMLGRVIGPGRVRSDQAAAERIVTACGMLPLAVRAAGLKLAILRHLPLGEYAARLDDPATALDELSAGDIAVRRHVADQWQHLGTSVRSALLRLGPLPALFTLDEAATALGCEKRQALRTVERLIEMGVVALPAGEIAASDALYAVSHLTRLYANEMAARSAIGAAVVAAIPPDA